MRRLVPLIATVLVATNALGVAPEFWRLRSAEEFLAGEIEGFAVTSRGELRRDGASRKVASVTDPFVLSQTSGDTGDQYFGTGNDGKVYRLRGDKLEILFTAPEPEIYALAFRGGALYAGSSPNGKVYRVDPRSGRHDVFFDPGQAYIWAIQALEGGDLAVATGVEGKIFRVGPKGEGRLFYDSADAHIRCLAEAGDGSLLAGASGKGRIYRIARDGSAHALYESSLNEISSVYLDSDGVGWAAAVTNVLPSSAPPKQQKGAQQQASGTTSAEGKKQEGEAAASVEVSFSFEEGSTPAASQGGSSEVLRIARDGFVETVRKFEREMIYAIRRGSNGAVLLASGPNGRVYELKDRELALRATVPEKQVVSISDGEQTLITTTNAGAVYRIDARGTGPAEFRSAARDTDRFSRFGSYRIEGRNLDGADVAMSFRSGNTRSPDSTWSAWSAPAAGTEGKVAAPAARYLQWKLTMGKSRPDATIEGVTVAYMNRNVAPSIDAVVVHDPAAIFIASGYPNSPAVVEATNPDEYGIFTSLDSPRERTGADQGKRAFRKGYRTVSWRAQDENGDALKYSVWFRKKGSESWLRLRENLAESQINFDTSQFPDGFYELRLTASDAEENPENPLVTTREGVEILVDNTPPVVAVSRTGDEVILNITDELSAIGKVEYAADAQKWTRLLPADGIADSRAEKFTLPKRDLKGKFVVVRALDAFFNVSTEAVPVD